MKAKNEKNKKTAKAGASGKPRFVITLDRDGCIGCGTCSALCEKYWKMDNDGMATLKGSVKKGKVFELETDSIECHKEAADACPVSVIKVRKL